MQKGRDRRKEDNSRKTFVEKMSADVGYHRPDQKKLQLLNDIANKLRIHSIESTNASKSGYEILIK